MTTANIPIARAFDALVQISKRLDHPHLLIGGIAVNYYNIARDTKDIDLVCSHKESKNILDIFTTNDWSVTDKHNDPDRPAYVAKSKHDSNIVVYFGPKLIERAAYKYLDWDIISENSKPITHKNKIIKNIIIPNVSSVAYSKIISFLFREDDEKRNSDIFDFVNLTNHDDFSVSSFINLSKRLNAFDLLNSKGPLISKVCEKYYNRSVMFDFYKLFVQSKGTIEPSPILEGASDRGESRFIDTMVDAVLFFRDATVYASDEIRSALDENKVIPTRLLYKTDEGCRSWIDLCSSPKYSFYSRSYNNLSNVIDDFVKTISKSAGRKDFDLISLGVGDGKKDGIILYSFIKNLDNASLLYYYPMDISLNLIEIAAHNLAANSDIMANLRSLRVKPFVGDFHGISKMKLFYDYRDSPNVFSILGNTIGNNDEGEIIRTLDGALNTGDFVIIEINTDKAREQDRDVDYAPENKNFDLCPLRAAGIKFKEKTLKYRHIDGSKIRNMYSIAQKTTSVISECDIIVKDSNNKDQTKKVKLSVVNYYEFDDFITNVSAALNAEVLHKHDADGVGLVLLRRLEEI